MHRLFVAIRPPEQIRDLLIDAMDDTADFRWQNEEQLHITLRFVGEVDRPVAEDLANALMRVRAERFSIRVRGVGRFEQRSSGTLWAGVEPKEPLAALATPSAAHSTLTSRSHAGRAAARARSPTSSIALAASSPNRSKSTPSSSSKAASPATARITKL